MNMKAVNRTHRWISLDHVLDRTRLEIRIHCGEPPTELPALLDAREARHLAAALLRMADQLAGEPAQRDAPQSLILMRDLVRAESRRSERSTRNAFPDQATT
jgi:hypothetical protein